MFFFIINLHVLTRLKYFYDRISEDKWKSKWEGKGGLVGKGK